MDTRRVNLTELGESQETLSSRIEWPDQYRPLDPVFAVLPVDEDPVVEQTLALVDATAAYVDEFTADALHGWLDEHLPGWASRTDFEMLRRMDVQRTLIAEITQNYALVAARITHQREEIAELAAVVRDADRVLAGQAHHIPDPADQPASSPTAVIPLALPDFGGFGHPDLSVPAGSYVAPHLVPAASSGDRPATHRARPHAGPEAEGEVA